MLKNTFNKICCDVLDYLEIPSDRPSLSTASCDEFFRVAEKASLSCKFIEIVNKIGVCFGARAEKAGYDHPCHPRYSSIRDIS
jgi:hypothetical protein